MGRWALLHQRGWRHMAPPLGNPSARLPLWGEDRDLGGFYSVKNSQLKMRPLHAQIWLGYDIKSC